MIEALIGMVIGVIGTLLAIKLFLVCEDIGFFKDDPSKLQHPRKMKHTRHSRREAREKLDYGVFGDSGGECR